MAVLSIRRKEYIKETVKRTSIYMTMKYKGQNIEQQMNRADHRKDVNCKIGVNTKKKIR